MFQALSKIWWLLAACGITDTLCAALNLLMVRPGGMPGLRTFASANAVWDMSLLALVAGACALAAGLWISGWANSWLLSLHGFALGAFGLIGLSPLVKGPLSFRPVSLLFVLMAGCLAVFAFRAARSPRNRAADRWFLNLSAAASLGFAISFIAVGFGRVRLGSPQAFWIWMSSYFGLCATFWLYLALRAHGRETSRSGPPPLLPRVLGTSASH